MRRRVALCIVALGIALCAIAGASAYSNNYVNNQTVAGYGWYSDGYNYWVVNRVWRPIGNWYQAAFDVSGGSWNAGWTINKDDNPFATSGSYGYNRTWCQSSESSDVSPVTCQSTS